MKEKIKFYQHKAFKSKLAVGLISLCSLFAAIGFLVPFLVVESIKQSIALNVVFLMAISFGFFGFLVAGILFPIYCTKNYVIVKDYKAMTIWAYVSTIYTALFVNEQEVKKDTSKSFGKQTLECLYNGISIKLDGKTIKVNGVKI
ncbi:MAG: hypothetical protein HUJ52_03980 [Malacoplasma sp.]|mgnify:CR=1 FL=1|nr:hypothetical protein [Malacoplasma sp.]